MRVEVLSDHGSEQLRHSFQQLRTAEADKATWEDEHRWALGDLRAARRTKSLWKRIFAVRTPEEREALGRMQAAWEQIRRADFGRQQMYHQIQQQSAGK